MKKKQKVAELENIIELQAAKIRFFLAQLSADRDSVEIVSEFMYRSYNNQDFSEF